MKIKIKSVLALLLVFATLLSFVACKASKLSAEEEALIQNMYDILEKHDKRYAKGIGNLNIVHFNGEENLQDYGVVISSRNEPNLFSSECYSFTLTEQEGNSLIEMSKKYFNTKEGIISIYVFCSDGTINNKNADEFYAYLAQYIVREQEKSDSQ